MIEFNYSEKTILKEEEIQQELRKIYETIGKEDIIKIKTSGHIYITLNTKEINFATFNDNDTILVAFDKYIVKIYYFQMGEEYVIDYQFKTHL